MESAIETFPELQAQRRQLLHDVAVKMEQDPDWSARLEVAVILGDPVARNIRRGIRMAAAHLSLPGRHLPTLTELRQALDEGRVVDL